MSPHFLRRISRSYEAWLYRPNFQMKKRGLYSGDCRHDLTFARRGEKSAPSCQAHPGILLSKPDGMLRHQPIIRFECGISLEGSLDLLSLRESEGELVLSILILSYLQLSCVPASISHEPGRRQKKRGTKSVTKTTLKLGGEGHISGLRDYLLFL